MKTTLLSFAAVLLLTALLRGAPLMETTAIHAQPDVSAPVIGLLKAGSEPSVAPDAAAPDGWLAVALPGPHTLYVENKDIGKSLHIHPGAALRLAPKPDAPVFALMEPDDKIEFMGLAGDWGMQVKLPRAVIGYIRAGGAAPDASPPLPAAARVGSTPAVPTGEVSAAMSRVFEGVFAPARRFLVIGPRPLYKYQLNDSSDRRIAFLDLGKNKLLAAENMEKYLDRSVIATGLLRQTEDGRDLVIEVESLQLKQNG